MVSIIIMIKCHKSHQAVFNPVTILVVHAEANAIMHKTCIDLKGCSLYTTLFPCNECAKLIIQSGIKKVYFLEGKPHFSEGKVAKNDKFYSVASYRLFQMAGYEVVVDLLDTSQGPDTDIVK